MSLPRTGPRPASSMPSQHGSFFKRSSIGDSSVQFLLLSFSNDDRSILLRDIPASRRALYK